jgi:hypothetical protein
MAWSTCASVGGIAGLFWPGGCQYDKSGGLLQGPAGQPAVPVGPRQVRHVPGTAGAAGAHSQQAAFSSSLTGGALSQLDQRPRPAGGRFSVGCPPPAVASRFARRHRHRQQTGVFRPDLNDVVLVLRRVGVPAHENGVDDSAYRVRTKRVKSFHIRFTRVGLANEMKNEMNLRCQRAPKCRHSQAPQMPPLWRPDLVG